MTIYTNKLTREILNETIQRLIEKECEEVPNNPEKFGCAPVRNRYYLHVDLEAAKILTRLAGWISSIQYPDQRYLANNEIGCIANFSVILNKTMTLIACNTPDYNLRLLGDYVTIEITTKD